MKLTYDDLLGIKEGLELLIKEILPLDKSKAIGGFAKACSLELEFYNSEYNKIVGLRKEDKSNEPELYVKINELLKMEFDINVPEISEKDLPDEIKPSVYMGIEKILKENRNDD